MLKFFVFALTVIFVATTSPTPSKAQGPKRGITKVAGDVYRFQNNFHFSWVVVTGDGVVVTDPINADASTWLKANLK